MKYSIHPIFYVALGLNIGCFSLATYFNFAKTQATQILITQRIQALDTIAKHHIAGTCWEVDDKIYKLGDVIEIPGTADSKSPTSCFYSKRGQVLHGAYENGLLTVKQVYSKRELYNQISVIKKQDKKETKTQ